ncbi:MAG: CoA transferase [Acidimicrobiales bacterium]|jgi:crotonobetainyl-CoA:carnitine CoA-transferase CaiB-like acyl-CoA transferase
MATVPATDGSLVGVKVLDCSQSLSAAFCAATLERMGADVVRVEIVDGPDGAASAFLDARLSDSEIYRDYLGRAKERRPIDLSGPAGRAALAELVSGVDVVVEDFREPLLATAGIDVTSVGDHPVPIVASVTPHGRGGPRRDDLASDLTLFHGAGPGHAVPGLVADPRTMAPLRLGSHQGSFVGGLVAAINVCAAVLARDRHPASAVVTVDVSCHEALVNSYRQSLGTFAYYGGGMGRDLAFGRGAGGMVDHRNLKCKDGYFNLAWGGVQQWDSLKGLLDHPEWMEDQDLATPALRYRNWVKIVPRLEEWAAEFEKEHLLYLCQGWRIPCAPVNEGGDVLAVGVLGARGFWQPVQVDGRTTSMPGLPSRRAYPARPAESN